ncbi:hypothetical protein A5625_07560 [Mycobacterium sp. 1465703.0]|nr:hypothetical protein A5625_07560 [Mycobacterium sp. 1465703.0]
MARMPDLSRRALLGLGAGAALGAVGVYGVDNLLEPRASHAAPVSTASTQLPLAPAPSVPRDPAPPAAAAPTMVTGSFVSEARVGSSRACGPLCLGRLAEMAMQYHFGWHDGYS